MMAKRKVTPRKAIKRVYDLDRGVLIMPNRKGDMIEYSFNGLSSEVFMKLAMVGAGSLLCKVSNPLALWERIRQNKFGQQRKYSNSPKIVKALARVQQVKIETAEAYWKEATAEEKARVKDSPLIKKELLKMQIEALETPVG
jgi:hypothetical protein